MNLKLVVRQAGIGAYWAEVPAIPGCVSQGDTMADLRANMLEAIGGCLSVDINDTSITGNDRVI